MLVFWVSPHYITIYSSITLMVGYNGLLAVARRARRVSSQPYLGAIMGPQAQAQASLP